jgi:hypothetical protein
MSSESSSDSNNKQDAKNDKTNFNPFIECVVLSQSVAIALINAYSEFVNSAPKMIEYWYNLFLNPSTRTEEQRRDKVKVE